MLKSETRILDATIVAPIISSNENLWIAFVSIGNSFKGVVIAIFNIIVENEFKPNDICTFINRNVEMDCNSSGKYTYKMQCPTSLRFIS